MLFREENAGLTDESVVSVVNMQIRTDRGSSSEKLPTMGIQLKRVRGRQEDIIKPANFHAREFIITAVEVGFN